MRLWNLFIYQVGKPNRPSVVQRGSLVLPGGRALGLVLFLLISLPVMSLPVMAAPAVTLDNGHGYHNLAPYLMYGFESEPLSTPQQADEQIQWQRAGSQNLNLGFARPPLWLRLEVETNGETASENAFWWLYLPYFALNEVDYYLVRNGEVVLHEQTGFDFPFSERSIDHRNYQFPVVLKERATVYLRVAASGALFVPLEIWQRDEIADHREKHHLLYGAYAGVIFAMIIYNLFLFSAIREPVYLSYIAYVASYLMLMMANEGFAFQYFWPDNPAFNISASPFFACLTGALALDFSMRFLDTRYYSPVLHRLMRYALILTACTSVVVLVVDYDFNFFINGLSVLFTFLVVVTSLQCHRKGCEQAFYFMLAWFFLLTGIFVFAGVMNGWIVSNFVTRHSLLIGSVAEVLMFSFALANRINIIKAEKNIVMGLQQQAVLGLKQAEMEIYEIAFKDRLTGLSNREKLSRYVNVQLSDEGRKQPFYLVIVHLKQLQEINKALGYAVGDELLVRVALALRTECESWLGGTGTGVADGGGFDAEKHLGALEGANFIVTLEEENEAQVERFCQRVLTIFDRPVSYNDMSIDVGACIGYSQADDKTTDFDGLLKTAQVAAETALDRGLGYLRYSEEMDPYSQKRITLMADLKHAILHDELKLFLQPKLSLHDNIVIGFEALLRWQHPRHGMVPPDEFIGLAEKSGVINELTDWVIQRAINYLKFFNERDLHPHISINISAKNLQQPFFAEQLIQSLKRKAIEADALCLEITETAMMDDPDKAMACLLHLKQQGFYLSLDDFGTGYSSLSYLSHLPLSEIKIDRSFVADIEKQQTPVIVETTLKMAKSFGLVSVAEGIETEAALKRIRAMGCDVAQGYFIARPQSFEDVVNWLATQPGYEVLRHGDVSQLKF